MEGGTFIGVRFEVVAVLGEYGRTRIRGNGVCPDELHLCGGEWCSHDDRSGSAAGAVQLTGTTEVG